MKYVYFFGNGQADGGKDDRDLLGGKGADLQEMSRLGVNVPPGFTITTEACGLFMEEGSLPEVVRQELHENLDVSRRPVARSSAIPSTRCWYRCDRVPSSACRA